VSAEFGFILLLFSVYIFCVLEHKAKSNTDVILNSGHLKMVDVHF